MFCRADRVLSFSTGVSTAAKSYGQSPEFIRELQNNNFTPMV